MSPVTSEKSKFFLTNQDRPTFKADWKALQRECLAFRKMEKWIGEVIYDNMLTDHGAKEVRVMTKRKGRDVVITVDVHQECMTAAEKIAYIFSFGSSQKRNPNAVGCLGVGERKANFAWAKTLTLIALAPPEVSSNGTRLAEKIVLDNDLFFQAAAHVREPDFPTSIIPVPADFPFENGRRIILDGILCPELVPDDAQFMSDLAHALPARFINSVTLNGKKLKNPVHTGSRPIDIHIDGLGDVHGELYVGPVNSPDELEFGISFAVVPFRKFVEGLSRANPDLAKDIRESFRDYRLKGRIEMPGLKKYKTPSQSELNPEFYTSSECRIFVRILLNGHLDFIATELLATEDERRESEGMTSLFNDIATHINTAMHGGFEEDRHGPGGDEVLSIIPRHFRIEVGDSRPVGINGLKKGDTVAWNAANSGGQLRADPENASSRIYEAGMVPGSHRITATVTRTKGKETHVSCNVTIVPIEKKSGGPGPRDFKAEPSQVFLYVEESRTVRLKNVGAAGNDFAVDISNPTLISVERSDDTPLVYTVTAGKVHGECTIRFTSKADAQIFTLVRCEVYALPPEDLTIDGPGKHKNPQPPDKKKPTLDIWGRKFIIKDTSLDGDQIGEIRSNIINIDSSKLDGTRRPDGLWQAILDVIAHCLAEWRQEHLGKPYQETFFELMRTLSRPAGRDNGLT